MSTANLPKPNAAAEPLVEGQRMDQPTFHDRYLAMPPGARAELIGGVVSTPSPVGFDHSDFVISIIVWLEWYSSRTPIVHPFENATVILDAINEHQPDAGLRIRPEAGGRTTNNGRYIAGAPELVIEVARTSRFIDLGPKLAEYERAGVREYLVVSVQPAEVLWHVFTENRLVVVAPDADGLYRSRVFPGLWLDPAALLARDTAALRAAVDRGLQTPEHAAFLARLAR